jgi:hypothetical protein
VARIQAVNSAVTAIVDMAKAKAQAMANLEAGRVEDTRKLLRIPESMCFVRNTLLRDVRDLESRRISEAGACGRKEIDPILTSIGFQ